MVTGGIAPTARPERWRRSSGQSHHGQVGPGATGQQALLVAVQRVVMMLDEHRRGRVFQDRFEPIVVGLIQAACLLYPGSFPAPKGVSNPIGRRAIAIPKPQ